MASKKNITGYHVAIEPKQHYMHRWSEEDKLNDQKNVCKDMIQQINRHVDEVGYIDLIEEAEMVCEHCGSMWSERESSYNGGCCDKDIEGGICGNS
jgi:methionyl-tRNA synthetase